MYGVRVCMSMPLCIGVCELCVCECMGMHGYVCVYMYISVCIRMSGVCMIRM